MAQPSAEALVQRSVTELELREFLGGAAGRTQKVDRPSHLADTDPRGGQDRLPSPSPYGRTMMIVFPLRRSVELRAATASSRDVVVPMFVRSRPSRTRCTISPSWARSASTTKSTARPPAGRASTGPRRTPAFLRP